MYVYCFVIEQFPFVCWKDCQIVFSICSTLWLVWKSCPTISTIQMQNWDQLWAVHLYFFILQAVCLVLVWVFISFSLLFLDLTAGCDHLVLFSQHSLKKKYMYLGQSLDVIAGWKREGVEASYTRLAFFDMYMCSFIEKWNVIRYWINGSEEDGLDHKIQRSECGIQMGKWNLFFVSCS